MTRMLSVGGELINQPVGDFVHDGIGDTVMKSRLQAQVNLVVDIIHHLETPLRADGYLSGKELQAA